MKTVVSFTPHVCETVPRLWGKHAGLFFWLVCVCVAWSKASLQSAEACDWTTWLAWGYWLPIQRRPHTEILPVPVYYQFVWKCIVLYFHTNNPHIIPKYKMLHAWEQTLSQQFTRNVNNGNFFCMDIPPHSKNNNNKKRYILMLELTKFIKVLFHLDWHCFPIVPYEKEQDWNEQNLH